jgi:hypothetical protein
MEDGEEFEMRDTEVFKKEEGRIGEDAKNPDRMCIKIRAGRCREIYEDTKFREIRETYTTIWRRSGKKITGTN